MSALEVERILGRPLTGQELEAIVRPLLERGVSPRGVVDALRATETRKPPAGDDSLRTIRYEALQDGTARRIPQEDIGES